MVKRVPGKTWKHGGKGSMNELEPPEIQTIPETILSVELSEKFCGFPLPLPCLIPFQTLPLVKFNWKLVDKES